MSQTAPCRTCRASLAPDQRYCLSCGTRVAAPRLDFVAETERAEAAARNGSSPAGAAGAAHGAKGAGAAATAVRAAAVPDGSTAAAPAATTAVPIATAPTPSRLDRIGGPMGAAAVVLVALGVGFLAGQARNATPPKQPAPVVNIEGGLPTGGAGTVATDPPATEQPNGDAAAAGDASATTRDAAAADDASATGRSSTPPNETTTTGTPPPGGEQPAADGSDAEANG